MSIHKPAHFTPGPWAVEPRQWDHGASLAIVAPHSGYIVAVVPFDDDIQTVDEPDYETVKRHPDEVPNAHLIAAAPAMYEALLKVSKLRQQWRADVIGSMDYMDELDALDFGALAQAEGREG